VTGEYKLPRCGSAPFFHASLQCSELAVAEGAGVVGTEAVKTLRPSLIRFGVEPDKDLRPDSLERILPRSPVSWWPRVGALSGMDFSVLPGCGRATEEFLEVSVTMRKPMGRRTCCEPRKVLLDRSDLVEELQRIERRLNFGQPLLHRRGQRCRRKQPSAGRLGRVIPRRSRASTMSEPSRTTSAAHSVHPLAMSVRVKVCAKLPTTVSPQ